MSFEAIKNILDSEEKAKKGKDDAALAAKRAAADAEQKGQKIIAAAILKAKNESEALAKKADGTVAEKSAELASKTENRKAAMRARAESKQSEAVDFIVERIVKG